MWNKIYLVGRQFSDDEIFTRAAALAFYTVLSFAPLAVLFVVSLSTLDLNLQDDLVNEIRGLAGPQAANLFETTVESAKSRPDLSSLSGWLGTLALLFSASLIFVQIQTTLNMIFKTGKYKDNENQSRFELVKEMILDRLISVGVLLAFVFVAIVSLLISSAMAYFMKAGNAWWAPWLSEGFSLLVFAILFAVIFKWMPDRQLNFSKSFLGGLITSVLFVVGKSAIGYYLGQRAIGSAYGAAGSLAVLLVWVYYSSLIMFLGAEISYVALMRPKSQ